ncbi:hypothetical protein OF375_03125 [Ureaplasma miroungigenitalium]|uniref:hypothetical protein n=1 Tax=Ureaplasma miroungigenitalium TaxID=1042321 RepID=UPI0021E902E0|nr:hypothetical protein [Ureaplasma miroungigenitalium]MCV3734554.1 hypothetical protein [Ureaplasma miroungigenitalium]
MRSKKRTDEDCCSKAGIPHFAYNAEKIHYKDMNNPRSDYRPIVVLIKENYVYYLNARSKKENGQNWPGEVEVNLFAKQAYVNISLSFLRIQKL